MSSWLPFSLVLLGAICSAEAGAQERYEEDPAATDSLRTEQARELEFYVSGLRSDPARRAEVFRPDYSSVRAFQASTRRLRGVLAGALGYPPPGSPPTEPPEFRRIATDSQVVYYRFRIAVLPGVHVVGLYLVPAGLQGRAPLVVAMHGGGGSPEVATFRGGANYHDMVRGAVERGYVVWAPQHLYVATGLPADIRQRIDTRARLAGTTITAIEIAKISRRLKTLARELNVPVIALSQLNRASESEQRLPRTSDLRESGSIEQDADVVMLLHREAVLHRGDQEWMDANPDKINEAQLIVAKQRNGPCDTVKLTFLAGQTRFVNYSPGV